jgi:DNA-binding XRE family transcriptional regulator
MDMQINVDRVRAERQQRAWSQEHLASASGLSLRTIQRVEASGVASNETLRSLAAVFECDLRALMLVREESLPEPAAVEAPSVSPGTPVRPTAAWKRPWLAFAAVAGIAVLSTVLVARAEAGDVEMEVILGGKTLDVKVFKLLAASGKEVEAQLGETLRVVFTPRIDTDDLIMLAARVYLFDGKEFRLVSSPKVLTRAGVNARIEIGLPDGGDLQMSVTPNLR